MRQKIPTASHESGTLATKFQGIIFLMHRHGNRQQNPKGHFLSPPTSLPFVIMFSVENLTFPSDFVILIIGNENRGCN